MNGRALLIGACAATAAAIIAALLTVGGPQAARRDRADDARLQDIRAIADALICALDDEARPLPQSPADLAATDKCAPAVAAILPADRDRGAQYDYARLGPDAFRICAAFHDPRRAAAQFQRVARWKSARRLEFDAETGCITGWRKGAARPPRAVSPAVSAPAPGRPSR